MKYLKKMYKWLTVTSRSSCPFSVHLTDRVGISRVVSSAPVKNLVHIHVRGLEGPELASVEGSWMVTSFWVIGYDCQYANNSIYMNK